MSTFKLQYREPNLTYHKITHGRKWVGRVYQHKDTGLFHAVLNGHQGEAIATTPEAAFEQRVAEHFGHSSADSLRAANASIRRQRADTKAHARYVFQELLQGNFQPLDRMFQHLDTK